jgi:hypothetical protein
MSTDLQKEVERLKAENAHMRKALVDIYNRLPIVRTTEPVVVSGLLYDIGEMAWRGICPPTQTPPESGAKSSAEIQARTTATNERLKELGLQKSHAQSPPKESENCKHRRIGVIREMTGERVGLMCLDCKDVELDDAQNSPTSATNKGKVVTMNRDQIVEEILKLTREHLEAGCVEQSEDRPLSELFDKLDDFDAKKMPDQTG